MQWSSNKQFNENNFNSTINLIQKVVSIYKDSLDNIISQSSFDKILELKDIQLFETLSTFIDNYPTSSRPNVKQTVIAIGGVLTKHPTIGVIAFRGTSNNQEWVKDAQSLRLVSLPKYPTSTIYGNIESLVGMNLDMIPDTLQVGEGFYKLYSTRIGTRTKDGCVCISDCSKHLCMYAQHGNYSMLDKDCQKTQGYCSTESGDSLNQQIYSYVKSMIKKGVKHFIITGHSLGGTLANLCAFHLMHSFGPNIIHSVYTYAPPRTGNTEFSLSLFPLYKNFYTIINSNDLVPNVPLPFPGCFSHCGNIYIFTEINVDIICDFSYIWKMHDLETYRKNYTYLFKN